MSNVLRIVYMGVEYDFALHQDVVIPPFRAGDLVKCPDGRHGVVTGVDSQSRVSVRRLQVGDTVTATVQRFDGESPVLRIISFSEGAANEGG